MSDSALPVDLPGATRRDRVEPYGGPSTGRTDLPLTEHGERAARRFGARLRGLRPGKVFTSPLRRAARTCELAGFTALGTEVEPDLTRMAPKSCP